jgi:hypothetical protein
VESPLIVEFDASAKNRFFLAVRILLFANDAATILAHTKFAQRQNNIPEEKTVFFLRGKPALSP